VPNVGGNATSRVPRTGRPVLATTIVVAVVAADQVSKFWAVRHWGRSHLSIVGDAVDLRLVRNTGSAFSLFQAFTPLLAIVAAVVAFFLVRAVHQARDPLMVVGLSLVLGGALGNLVDRLLRAPGFLRGAVVDFVHVGAWPIFNVADAAITVGVVLIVVWALRADARERREGARGAEHQASGG
jgi:signal peptidase II